MQSFLGVEEVRYGGERQVEFVFDKVLDAFKQLVDRGQRGETNCKCFTSGGISCKQIQVKHLQTNIASLRSL